MPGFIIGKAGYKGYGPPIPAISTGEYYYTYTWTIFELFESSKYDAFKQANATINLKECTLPTFNVTKETVQGASLEYKFAKGISYDDIKVTWYDSHGLLPYIIAWRSSVWTPETGINVAHTYKKLSKIVTYLPTGGGQNWWNLVNSWPSTIRYGDLTYTNSDVKLIDVTVTYDWLEEKFENTSTVGGELPSIGDIDSINDIGTPSPSTPPYEPQIS